MPMPMDFPLQPLNEKQKKAKKATAKSARPHFPFLENLITDAHSIISLRSKADASLLQWIRPDWFVFRKALRRDKEREKSSIDFLVYSKGEQEVGSCGEVNGRSLGPNSSSFDFVRLRRYASKSLKRQTEPSQTQLVYPQSTEQILGQLRAARWLRILIWSPQRSRNLGLYWSVSTHTVTGSIIFRSHFVEQDASNSKSILNWVLRW